MALADQLLLVAMLEPGHRAALAVPLDERQDVPQVAAMMQVEEFRRAPGIVTRHRVGRDVVDSLVAHPHDAAVVESFQILLAGAQHADLRISSQWSVISDQKTALITDH